MIALYLMLISCNEKQNEDTATEEETEEETQDDTATEEEEEEEEITSVCSPKPNLQTANISLELFDVAMSFATESCFLDDVDITLNGQSENNISFDAPTALECDDDDNHYCILLVHHHCLSECSQSASKATPIIFTSAKLTNTQAKYAACTMERHCD